MLARPHINWIWLMVHHCSLCKLEWCGARAHIVMQHEWGRGLPRGWRCRRLGSTHWRWRGWSEAIDVEDCGQDLVGNYRTRAWLGVTRALNGRNLVALMINNHFQLGPTYPATNDYASLARISTVPHCQWLSVTQSSMECWGVEFHFYKCTNCVERHEMNYECITLKLFPYIKIIKRITHHLYLYPTEFLIHIRTWNAQNSLISSGSAALYPMCFENLKPLKVISLAWYDLSYNQTAMQN